jgi:hypothetical protein
VITGSWGTLRATLAAGMKALNRTLAGGQVSLPTLVDMDLQDKALYMVIGSDIRQLDLSAIAQTIGSGSISMTLDEIAVRRVTATQFDVK